MNRPIGRTDIEDAFKRLDKLTLEEAWMAVAQCLKAANNVDEKVRGAVAVGDRVASVDGEAANVDERVRKSVTTSPRLFTVRNVPSIDCRSIT